MLVKNLHGAPWSQEQDEQLLYLLKVWGEDLSRIAKHMGRSERGIKERKLVLTRAEKVEVLKAPRPDVNMYRNRPEPSLELRQIQEENNRRVEAYKEKQKADFNPGEPAIW